MTARRPRYRMIDHTADLGIALRAPSRERLYEDAALALFDILTDLDRVEPREDLRIEIEGVDAEDLMVRWLSELLSLHGAKGWLFAEFRIESIGAQRLAAVASGERLDPERHVLKGELKAATHHQALVCEDRDGWTARIVFDV